MSPPNRWESPSIIPRFSLQHAIACASAVNLSSIVGEDSPNRQKHPPDPQNQSDPAVQTQYRVVHS